MEKAYTLTKQISTFTICCIIFSALVILFCRALRFTLSVLRAVWRWIQTKHNFTPGDDEDPVTLTGAQYLGVVLLCVVVVFVLSIKL